MKYEIGIDPGLNGGIAVLNGDNVVFTTKTPIDLSGEIDVVSIGKIIQTYQRLGLCKVILEKVHAMPGQGVCAMFTFGEGFGAIKAVLKLLKVPYLLVTPQEWKKHIFVGIAWKAKSEKLKIPEGAVPQQITELKAAHTKIKTAAKKEAKGIAAAYVQRRFPAVDLFMGKKNAHDGIADAICLAEYGQKR